MTASKCWVKEISQLRGRIINCYTGYDKAIIKTVKLAFTINTRKTGASTMAKLGGSDTKKIAQEAYALLEAVFGDLESLKLPVDLDRILKHCGLTVRVGEFKDDNLAGAFNRDKKTIYVDESDSFRRQNFTIAHELGHFKLHEDIKRDIFTREQVRQFTGDGVETEANWFAASLLMPEKLVKRSWKTFHDATALSIMFGVSPMAMRYRLKDLKLI